MRNWLARLIFLHNRNPRPDGRPLYAYKLRDKDYQDLKSLVRQEFTTGPQEDIFSFAPLFCLFAAETWRRCHVGGPWAWETVFQEIGQDVPVHSWIARMVEKGLQWWQRPLLTSKDGSKQFLVTIACEGGLPLKLLQQDNSRLARYFRKVLTAWHQEKRFGKVPARAIAEENGAILPPSLRRDVVFQLSYDLIGKIIELQEQVADAADPVAMLEREHAGWQQELPLPLENETAEALLNNLVRESWKLSITNKIRWRRLLRKKGEEWQLEQVLELPRRLTGEALAQWCNTGAVTDAVRLRILLQAEGEQRQIGLLTLIAGNNDEKIYHCEGVSGREVRLTGRRALAAAPLFISDGRNRYQLPVSGDQELGPLPWFFAIRKNENMFIGDGTVRTGSESVLAVVPAGGEFQGEAAVEPVGEIPSCSREIVKIAGSGSWMKQETGTVGFRCGATDAKATTLVLAGPRLPVAMPTGLLPPFRGMPKLIAVSDSGVKHNVSGVIGQWRPDRAGEAWRDGDHGCAGTVWVRFLDSESNLLLLRKIEVVPTTFFIQVDRSGDPATGGSLLLSELTLEGAEPEQMEDYTFTTEQREEGIRITAQTHVSMPVTQFLCRLSWGQGKTMILPLPFPCTSAAFIRGGRPFPAQSRVAVSALAVIQAQVQQPVGCHYFSIVVDLWANQALVIREAVNRRIQLDTTGRGTFDLLNIQEQVTSLLALTGDIDSTAVIKILDHVNTPLAKIEVGLFELYLSPDYEAGIVAVAEQSRAKLEEDALYRIEESMMRLWAPDAERITLERSADMFTWQVPADLDPGPWLILGEDGNWPRFRPVLWNVPGEAETSGKGLFEQAVKAPEYKERQARMGELIEQLAADPTHPDWSKIASYIQWTRQYPAVTFEFFRHLVKNPEAMVLILLKSDDEDFDIIWSLAYQLPFSWHLLPVAAWKNAATVYITSMRDALSTLEGGEQIVLEAFNAFRERVTGRQPFFRQICDWLSYHLFPEAPLDNSELMLARQAPTVMLGFVQDEEQAFQARHSADEIYPEGPEVMARLAKMHIAQEFHFTHLQAHLRPVRCAPFVAAGIATRGAGYDEKFLYELLKLRSFDQEWFDRVFALALCLELAGSDTFFSRNVYI